MSLFVKALPAALLGAAALGAVALPAAAQQAGTYSGSSADGVGLNFVVATDPDTNVLAVTSAGVGFSALCSDGSIFNSGWGFGVGPADIVNRKVSFVSADSYFTITVSLKFSADGQSATGTIMTVSPTLSPVGPKPKKALFCTSASQGLGVTLVTAGAKPPLAAKGPYLLKSQPSR